MSKIAGAALMMCASGLWCAAQVRRWREEVKLARELGMALERMEGMIRWQNLAIPQIMVRESERLPCGVYFAKIVELVGEGGLLHTCWTDVWRTVACRDIRQLLCSVELSGDALQIMGSLHMTAQQLYHKSEELRQAQQQKARLCITASVALTAMTAIILI